MKETYYFSHDYNARNDRKMQRLIMKQGVEGVGIFWCIVEMLYEEGGSMLLSECERIAFELRTDCERINFVLLESELFENDGKTFWSNSVLDRLNKRKEKSVKAKESADKRWAYANALRLECDGNAIKDSKPKETKPKETENAGKTEEEILKEIFEQYKDYFSGYSIKEHCGRLLNTTPETLEKLMAYFLLVNGKQMTVECKTKYAAEKYFINWAKKEANKQEVLNNYNRIFKPKPKQ